MSTGSTDSLTYGRYQLVERIASGGMGEVWIGLQTGIGSFRRPIAVKLLLPHLVKDRAMVGMFLDEARVGAQINHANVAQVYDVGFEHERYFIAMELVRGVALSTLISALAHAGRPPSAELVACVAWGLCEGLHIAHEQRDPEGRPLNLVHRDVTPHNVLVSAEGAVKLTDFGIARVADARRSTPGVVMGKLGYLAPEQLSAGPVDRRADVFAAGATLYCFAALKKPFDDHPAALTLPRVPKEPLARLRPELPEGLVAAIDRALEPDLTRRFPTARELRNALPLPHPDTAEKLGAMVRELCGSQVVELDGVASRVTAVLERSATPGLPGLGGPAAPTVLQPPTAGPKRRVGPYLVLAACALAGVGATLAWPRLASPPPSVPEAPPSPGPVPAPIAKDPEPSPPPVVVAPPPPAATEATPDAGARARGAGFLSVDAVPWGEVFVDGRRVGETPLGHARVSAGPHVVLVQNPGTGAKARRQVVVSPGAHVPLRLELK